MGYSYVVGLQGKAKEGTASTARYRTAAMVKHYVGFGTPMGGLNTGPVSLTIDGLRFLDCNNLMLLKVVGGERDMRSLYLPPFKRAIVDGGALTIMSAYRQVFCNIYKTRRSEYLPYIVNNSSYDGIPAAVDKHLLTEILRGEWGYEGFVESDSGAIAFLCSIFYTCDPKITNNPEAAVRAVKAGNDVEMGGQAVSQSREYLPCSINWS